MAEDNKNTEKQCDIHVVIKRLINAKKLELKALDRYGFVPKEIPNYKELMTNEDYSKVKGYTDGYKQAMEDICNALTHELNRGKVTSSKIIN